MRRENILFTRGMDQVAHEPWCPEDYRDDSADRAFRRLQRRLFQEALLGATYRFLRELGGSRRSTNPGREKILMPGTSETSTISVSDVKGFRNADGTFKDGFHLLRRLNLIIWRREFYRDAEFPVNPLVWYTEDGYFIENSNGVYLRLAVLRARGIPTLDVRVVSPDADNPGGVVQHRTHADLCKPTCCLDYSDTAICPG